MPKIIQIIGDLEHVSRSGVKQCMSQLGEVVHVHKPPAGSGDPIEDAAVVTFAKEEQAEAAVKALKEGRVFIDGVCVSGDYKKSTRLSSWGGDRPVWNGDIEAIADDPAAGTGNRRLAIARDRIKRPEKFDQNATSMRELVTGSKRSRTPPPARERRPRRRSDSRESQSLAIVDRGYNRDRGGYRDAGSSYRDSVRQQSGGREWICQLTTPRPSMRDFLEEPPRRSSRPEGGRRTRDRRRRRFAERDEDDYSDGNRCEDDGYGA